MTMGERLRPLLEATPGVTLAVLFGSHARGDAGRQSDVDLALHAPLELCALNRLLADLERAAGRAIDLVRMDVAPPLLRFEIARDGVVLLERAPHAWQDFRARAMVDWWEWAPFAERFATEAVRRLRSEARLEVASIKIERAGAWLTDVERLVHRPLAEFSADVAGRDLAAFYLFLAAQECVDLAAHWISDAGWPAPRDIGSTFDTLADRGAIDRPLADEMRAVVRVRNRIAHGYASVDHERFHAEAPSGVDAMRRLLAAVSTAAGL